MRCCAALAKAEQNRAGRLAGLRRKLETEARLRGYCVEDIKRRLAPVAGVLGLADARDVQAGLQADYYRTLKVSAGAGDSEVKKAFCRLARQTHPYAAGGGRERFMAVHEAYEVLSDPARRRQYDQSRRHEMHLPWTEETAPGYQGGRGQDDFPAGQVRGTIYLMAAVVAGLIFVAIVADMIIRR
ncbi:MAG: J domain-containing protein [Desulfobacteraceae bacterium]|nr:J domain-containing protein [Desulfobacteraceae bacterium]